MIEINSESMFEILEQCEAIVESLKPSEHFNITIPNPDRSC